MDTYLTSAAVFVCLFGAAILGLHLRKWMAEHHLNSETKDSVRMAMATVGSMAALVLALLVASTKGAYDDEKKEVIQLAAEIVHFDRLLKTYGPETEKIRLDVRRATETAMERMWPTIFSSHSQLDPSQSWSEKIPGMVHDLNPKDERQRSLKSQLTGVANSIGQLRWLMYEEAESSISMPLLVMVVVWLGVVFISAGLFSPSNRTTIAAFFLSALSVGGAVFLILELDLPFDGLVRISERPLKNALEHMAK